MSRCGWRIGTPAANYFNGRMVYDLLTGNKLTDNTLADVKTEEARDAGSSPVARTIL